LSLSTARLAMHGPATMLTRIIRRTHSPGWLTLSLSPDACTVRVADWRGTRIENNVRTLCNNARIVHPSYSDSPLLFAHDLPLINPKAAYIHTGATIDRERRLGRKITSPTHCLDQVRAKIGEQLWSRFVDLS